MKKILLLMTMILTCVGTWAQLPAGAFAGCEVTFTNIQKDGTTKYTLYINENNELALSTSSAEELGATAKFFVEKRANNKYSFYNREKKLYMIWRGKSAGYNSDKGVLGEYNATYCDWTINAGAEIASTQTYFFVSKRSNGTSDGSPVVMKSNGVFDAWGNTQALSDTYSNLYNIEIANREYVADPAGFENGMAYTFVTERGWMGAKDDNTKAISTAYTANGVTGSADNENFQWAVYKSAKGRYYLYNLGKKMFLGKESNNNTAIPFVSTPTTENLTFKTSSSSDYPIMFSTDNAAVVNHSANHASGLISWTGGWNNLNDDGSNHKVTLVRTLTDAELQTITNLVSAYEGFPFKVEVDGLEANNPNTHFGRITATMGTNVKTTSLTTEHLNISEVSYNGVGDVIAFTRDYRGFTFQGFCLGTDNLGKSFTLTTDILNRISADTPLVAKFTATNDVTLFYDNDPFSYRIPAIAKTSTGRIIAVSDYRYSLDDIGRYNFGTQNPGIDLVMRYSDNNGETWSETKTIAKGSCVRGTDDCAYGDAAIAVVGEKVLVMAAAGDVMFGNGSATSHNRAVRLYSEDNGETWTKQDISETLFINADATINSGYSSFFGSGRLAVDENYNNTGKPRIYGALLLRKASGTGNYVIYTDDFGLTWSILGGSQNPIANQDEPKVEILPSGQILLSVRRGGGRQFNVFTYTDKATNAGSWDTNVNGCNNGGANTCNGEPYCVDAKKADGSSVKLLLQSQPKGGSGLYDRRDVTIWYKEIADDNYTSAQIAADWIQGIQVSTQQSAYSAMALQEDGRIGFFFEEAPCYDDDQAKGYCMVYTPLTIESITKANYFSPNTDLNAVKTINVELTDAQGNIYREQVECLINGVASDLTNKYPYITLGDKASLNVDGDIYTYTNTVTLPFKVSNANTTVWHNIYWPANTNENAYPVYLSASEANDTYVPKVTESAAYGNSSYNTADNADKISWAIYNVDNGFTFKFKNKLTGKYIQVTSVATGNAQNAKYVDEAATAFEIVPDNASYKGDYTLKASVGGSVGYLCSTSATGYHYATHYSGNEHQGAWVKFVEAPDFVALIADINESLDMIGTSLGLYKVTGANATKAEAAKTAMQNSGSAKLNELNTYTNLLDGATLNMPKDGQFFRVAYDYGNSTGKLYLQSLASSVKGVQFTAETGNTSIWLYHNGALYSYKAGQCLREVGDDRGLQAIGGKTDVTFRASSRAKGKYTIQCTSYVHANSSGTNHFTDHCSSDSHSEHDLILEEVTTLPVTIGTAGASTLYAPVALTLPELSEGQELKVYTAVQNGEYLTLTEVESVIPANTGVILMGTAGTYNFTISDDASDPVGQLIGTVATKVNPNDGTIYTLQKPSDAFVMKKYNGANLNGFKAYYKMPANSNVQALRLSFGETTGIDGVVNAGGKLEIYDMSGRRVEKMTKGLYIVNGQKVLVK